MSTTEVRRDSYTYSFSQLSARDALVFKSVISLLDGRTHGLWTHVEAGESDLLVQGCARDGQVPSSDIRRAKVVLMIGEKVPSVGRTTLTLGLPLRSSELFERLEEAHELMAAMASPVPDTPQGARVRLLRWPPSAVLHADPRFMRLAALLSSRALSAAELSRLGAVPVDQCQFFIDELFAAGVAARERLVELPVDETRGAPKGLFARIRAHLGLFSPQEGGLH